MCRGLGNLTIGFLALCRTKSVSLTGLSTSVVSQNSSRSYWVSMFPSHVVRA